MLLSHARQVTLGNLQVALSVTAVELSVCNSLCMNGLLNVPLFHVEFSFFFSLLNPYLMPYEKRYLFLGKPRFFN